MPASRWGCRPCCRARSSCSASSAILRGCVGGHGVRIRISDLELASRLSFFLWSSIPDDELLDLAARGDLDKPAVLERQVTRMLADPRSSNLVTNFASQWLHLRNLDSMTPDMRLFPDFDDNLRQAFRQETEMLVDSVIREDRSVLDLLRANYTFVNERLAKHYGIPNVYGSRFRRVEFGEDGAARRAASPGQHSAGDVVSDAHIAGDPRQVDPRQPARRAAAAAAGRRCRRSKTRRRRSRTRPMRERLAEHRANPACAGCHRLMDPVGFALENYDAVGRWRTVECRRADRRVGHAVRRHAFRGVADLQKAILAHPELFVTTLSEKLLTFATGRGVEYYDAPAIRKIVRDAARRRLPLLVDHHGHRQQHAIPDEESIMIITKKALPRRTFLRGMGATVALPLLDAMVPSMTAQSLTPAKPGAPPRVRLHPDGLAHRDAGRLPARAAR